MPIKLPVLIFGIALMMIGIASVIGIILLLTITRWDVRDWAFGGLLLGFACLGFTLGGAVLWEPQSPKIRRAIDVILIIGIILISIAIGIGTMKRHG